MALYSGRTQDRMMVALSESRGKVNKENFEGKKKGAAEKKK